MEHQDCLDQTLHLVPEMVRTRTEKEITFVSVPHKLKPNEVTDQGIKVLYLLTHSLTVKFRSPFFLVICARGKLAFNHPGNKYFRYIVSKMHESYKEAETKLQRSIVVSEVVDMIRSKGLGFVKKNSNGQWSKSL